MDIYLTDIETGAYIRFPMLPGEVKVSDGAEFYDYQLINIGNVKLPSGENLTQVSWNAMFPGAVRSNEPYIRQWTSPDNLIKQLNAHRAGKKKLRLLITGTQINLNVYLSTFSGDYSHGYGDYNYSIAFVQAKDLVVNISGAGIEEKTLGTERPSAPNGNTYTVVEGDTLWSIAEKLMGGGSRYPELYEANRDMLDKRNQAEGSDKYMIHPGDILVIPDPRPHTTTVNVASRANELSRLALEYGFVLPSKVTR
ncbi:MAG: LysM peptidoglycan-binding domain-containing protein [Oscillospiraceae bacterium]|nr:LysM peptidoglycan-binding domain-containing protein [Oscillospiraceae bacterium]